MKKVTISLMMATILTLVSCSTSTTNVEDKKEDSTAVDTVVVDSVATPVADTANVVVDSTNTK
jgi:hypothetical protein